VVGVGEGREVRFETIAKDSLLEEMVQVKREAGI
jgi:hypothetical protein